ncbi:MAG: type III-A CRISPR-associated RAMP protein Csm5 [Candidatus Goldbacteria bacterium]|nr:type III-A CRISPR-associated RAMP protein Csm5 [Candidatus Goldiibacteriota bacterium]
MSDIIETIKLKCKTLTPVHIGSKEELDPFDYVIDNDKKLYVIDFHNLTKVIDDSEIKKLLDYASKRELGNLRVNIRNLFLKYKNNLKPIRTIEISESFWQKYNDEIQKSNINNNLSIQMNVTSNNKPIIPGSSIKGAIRTYVLEGRFMTYNEKEELKKEKYDLIESKLLKAITNEKKDISKDPFKILKISDVILPENSTIIYEVLSKNATGRGKGIPIYLEVIKPGIEFDIEMGISKYYLNDTNYIGYKDIIESGEKIKNLFKFITNKIINKKNNELQRLKSYKCFDDIEKKKLEAIYSNIRNNQNSLLRIGFGSGYDFVTVEGYREYKEPKKGKPGEGWGYSKNLTSDLQPLGFISINF